MAIKNTYWLSLHLLDVERILTNHVNKQKGFNQRAKNSEISGSVNDARYWKMTADELQPSIDELKEIIALKKAQNK